MLADSRNERLQKTRGARARCEKRCTNAGVEKGVDEINERRGRTRARERVEAETGGNRVAARGLERVH